MVTASRILPGLSVNTCGDSENIGLFRAHAFFNPLCQVRPAYAQAQADRRVAVKSRADQGMRATTPT